MKKFFKKFGEEFKAFALRGNVIDLAVGVIIGSSFQSVVNAIVNIIMQIITASVGQINYYQLSFRVGIVDIAYGTVITALINFIIIAFALFFLVKAINAISGKRTQEKEAPTTKLCPYCKTDIHKEAIKCPNCTSDI